MSGNPQVSTRNGIVSVKRQQPFVREFGGTPASVVTRTAQSGARTGGKIGFSLPAKSAGSPSKPSQ